MARKIPSTKPLLRIPWDDLRFALAVHRAGTFARAASLLRVDATTVARRVAALEREVGARIFARKDGACFATEAGGALLARAERMEAEALALERELMGADERLSGTVRLAATEFVATRFLAPHVPRFTQRYPNLCLVVVCSQTVADLARREADVAVRLTRPREPSVVARKFWQIDLGLFASKAYIEQRGRTRLAPADLRRHDVVAFAPTRAFASENAWIDEHLAGARIVLRSDSVAAVYNACVAGAGLALLPIFVAERDTALVHVTSADGLAPRDLWQAVHEDLVKAPRIRAVTEFLREILTAETPARV